MSKTIDSLVQTSIDSKQFAGVILAKLSFDSPTGDLRYSNSYQTIYWDEGSGEEEYLGLGNLADISVLNETDQLGAETIQLSLSGIPNASLTNALSTRYIGNPCYVWYATLDKDTYAVEGGSTGPVLIFAGLMDYATIEFGETVTIIMNATSRLADWERPRGGRFNEAYQKRHVDPTDSGFDQVRALQNKEISWGGQTVLDPGTGTTNNGGGGRGEYIPIDRERG
jgi:hypothetical protein